MVRDTIVTYTKPHRVHVRLQASGVEVMDSQGTQPEAVAWDSRWQVEMDRIKVLTGVAGSVSCSRASRKPLSSFKTSPASERRDCVEHGPVERHLASNRL